MYEKVKNYIYAAKYMAGKDCMRIIPVLEIASF